MSFSGRARALALVVLVALLFCYGFVGTPQHAPEPQKDHSLVSSEHDGASVAHPDYYAVLLISVLLGAAVGLLLGGARTWSKKPIGAPFVEHRRFAPPVLHLARGPTAPFIQVFRL